MEKERLVTYEGGAMGVKNTNSFQCNRCGLVFDETHIKFTTSIELFSNIEINVKDYCQECYFQLVNDDGEVE